MVMPNTANVVMALSKAGACFAGWRDSLKATYIGLYFLEGYRRN
jgi:hypothetical protein